MPVLDRGPHLFERRLQPAAVEEHRSAPWAWNRQPSSSVAGHSTCLIARREAMPPAAIPVPSPGHCLQARPAHRSHQHSSRIESAGISILLSRLRTTIPPFASAGDLSASVPEPKNRTRPAGPLPEPKGHDLPHFEAISQTPLPQLPSVVQIGFAWLPRLSGLQRQSQNPPQHVCETV